MYCGGCGGGCCICMSCGGSSGGGGYGSEQWQLWDCDLWEKVERINKKIMKNWILYGNKCLEWINWCKRF